MLQLTQTIVSLKQAIRRGVSACADEKLSKAKPVVPEQKRVHLNTPWMALDRNVWPCQISDPEPIMVAVPRAPELSNRSSDSLPSSTPPTSVAPSVFSIDNSSSSTVSTLPSPSPPWALTTNQVAGELGGRCDIEWEYKEMFLSKGGNLKVSQLSDSHSNAVPGETVDPRTLGSIVSPGSTPTLYRKPRVTTKRAIDPFRCVDVYSFT